MLVFLASLVFSLPVLAREQSKTDIYLFYGQGCPHCETVKSFLSAFKVRYRQNLEIREFEVYFDEEGRDLFARMAKAYDAEIQGVPMLFIDEEVVIGANLKKIEQEATRCLASKSCISPERKLAGYETIGESNKEIDKILETEKPRNQSVPEQNNPPAEQGAQQEAGQRNDASSEEGGTIGWIAGGVVLFFLILGIILFMKRTR